MTIYTLEVREVPLLQLWLLELEVLGHGLSGLALLSNSEGELLVQWQTNGFGTIDRLVNLKTNIEVLAGQEIGPVRK